VRSRRWKWAALTVGLAVWSAWQRPACARVLQCRPQVLYRGDTLTIELPTPHHDYEFAVWTQHLKLMMISFRPRPKDRFAPAVAPDVFRTMKKIKLGANVARGSGSYFWHGSELPRASGPPQLIFTSPGLYELLLGPAIGAEDEDFDGCWVRYVTRARPKTGDAQFKSKSRMGKLPRSNGEVADVGSIKMSPIQVRALRRAAADRGALMIQEGDHFHLQF
jgi:hypothetical protein